ncbi:PAS domain S-box protein [candidate division KSB1 bacterium]|nr:PAS domain S-box protein [candidate division KSB1 bacterium]
MKEKQEKIIFYIDKDELAIQNFKTALQETDIAIHFFRSGLEAFDQMWQIQPRLICCGFYTNDLNAKELLQKMNQSRSLNELRTTPFVLFSDKALRDEYGEILFKKGLSGWFTKPFGPHEIREVIQNLFLLQNTLRKNIELSQKVKRSEYRYRDLLENASDLIFTLDLEGYFTFLNNRFTTLTGFSKTAWIEKHFRELILEAEQKGVEAHLQMVSLGKARLFEARIERLPVILSFSITPLFEKGSIVGAVGIGRDVTEQKDLEKNLTDLKNFNESIIQSMEAGLLTIDPDSRITSLNQYGESVLGIQESELLGKPIDTVLPQDQLDLLLNKADQLEPLSYGKEIKLQLPTGKHIYVGFTVTDRIDDSGKKVGNILSFRDITLLKQMKDEVLRMDRLASLGVLASGIAHEIKNPLAGIKTMAQACEEEMDLDDAKKEYLVRITRQVDRLNSLLNTFFTFAKPKPPDRRPHSLHDILYEVTHLVRKKMSNQKIEYKMAVPVELPNILVDALQMQQVFLNLILNAIDVMPDGGLLSIRASIPTDSDLHDPILFPEKEGDTLSSNLLIIISDSGSGMSEELMQRIYDPFYTTKSNGLGLGLSIVYRIIQEHGGKIQVKSKTDEGTSFYLFIPTGVEL